MRVLFVCTGNVARSPMAAAIFEELVGREARHAARTAGTDAGAARRLTTRDLAWADVVAVMEAGHRELIRQPWPEHAPKVRVLDVPDDYDPGERELREVLTPKIEELVRELDSAGALRTSLPTNEIPAFTWRPAAHGSALCSGRSLRVSARDGRA